MNIQTRKNMFNNYLDINNIYGNHIDLYTSRQEKVVFYILNTNYYRGYIEYSTALRRWGVQFGHLELLS